MQTIREQQQQPDASSSVPTASSASPEENGRQQNGGGKGGEGGETAVTGEVRIVYIQAEKPQTAEEIRLTDDRAKRRCCSLQ